MTNRCLKFKSGVSLIGMQSEAIIGIDKCLDAFSECGLIMTLTSCRDGEHIEYSHHYKGLAWDIRVWDLSGRIDWMCNKIQTKLGLEYQVFNEATHIHVEYDPIGIDNA